MPRPIVSLLGNSDVFPDYEVGFIQTILDDLMLAEYVSGHIVREKLPVPIRAAQVRGGIPVPAPWTALDANSVKRPDANGQASVKASWRLNTEFATFLSFFRPRGQEENIALLDTWQRHTNVAIWLVARRLGAPLDRFSVHFLDGIIYELTQNFNVDIRRIRGDLVPEDRDVPGVEHEFAIGVGSFQAAETSEFQADPRLAQFGNPVAGEIDLNRHENKILLPGAATKDVGMGIEEYKQVAQQILDDLVVFGSDEEMRQGGKGTDMPRLRFRL